MKEESESEIAQSCPTLCTIPIRSVISLWENGEANLCTTTWKKIRLSILLSYQHIMRYATLKELYGSIPAKLDTG